MKYFQDMRECVPVLVAQGSKNTAAKLEHAVEEAEIDFAEAGRLYDELYAWYMQSVLSDRSQFWRGALFGFCATFGGALAFFVAWLA